MDVLVKIRCIGVCWFHFGLNVFFAFVFIINKHLKKIGLEYGFIVLSLRELVVFLFFFFFFYLNETKKKRWPFDPLHG